MNPDEFWSFAWRAVTLPTGSVPTANTMPTLGALIVLPSRLTTETTAPVMFGSVNVMGTAVPVCVPWKLTMGPPRGARLMVRPVVTMLPTDEVASTVTDGCTESVRLPVTTEPAVSWTESRAVVGMVAEATLKDTSISETVLLTSTAEATLTNCVAVPPVPVKVQLLMRMRRALVNDAVFDAPAAVAMSQLVITTSANDGERPPPPPPDPSRSSAMPVPVFAMMKSLISSACITASAGAHRTVARAPDPARIVFARLVPLSAMPVNPVGMLTFSAYRPGITRTVVLLCVMAPSAAATVL